MHHKIVLALYMSKNCYCTGPKKHVQYPEKHDIIMVLYPKDHDIIVVT